MSIVSNYRKFREHSPFMLVGSNAAQALAAAKLLDKWEQLEKRGLVRITSIVDDEPDPSFYDTWEHLSERTKRKLKDEYCESCRVVFSHYRLNDGAFTKWKVADCIGGCAGYKNECSPFENGYVIDLMQAAIDEVEAGTPPAPSQIRPLYREIASRIVARENCRTNGNTEWHDKHSEWLDYVQANLLPSGSGIDCGTKIDIDRSNGRKLVLTAGYHHMNEGGFYYGWTEHTITVTPSFDGIDIVIGGHNRNDIKDYLGEVYYHALTVNLDIRQEQPTIWKGN